MLNYILRRQPALAGVVATSSGMRTSLEEQKLKIGMSKVLGTLAPGMSMPDRPGCRRYLSVIPKWWSATVMIPWCTGKPPWVWPTACLGRSNGLLPRQRVETAPAADARQRRQDRLPARQPGIRRLTGSYATLKVWEGLAHECHNEPEKEQVLAFMLGWLESCLVEHP